MDVHYNWKLKNKINFYSHFLLKYYLFVFPFPIRTLNSQLSLSTLSALSQLPLTATSPPPRCWPTPPTHAANPRRQPISPLLFFFFFFPVVGYGMVVVVVVWANQRPWVARFVGISGLWLGSLASVGGLGGFRGGGCGCCLVGLVGVGLVDFFFFFFVMGCGGGGGGCGCVCSCDCCLL